MTRTPAHRIRRAIIAVTAGVAVAVALSGCATPSNGEKPTNASSPSTTPAPEATAVSIPHTPVGERIQWLVDLMNQPDDVTEADLDGVFADSFAQQVSAADVVSILNTNLRPAKPILVTAYDGSDTVAQAQAEGQVGDPFTIEMTLNTAGEIAGLAFTPVSKVDPATSMDEVKERLEALPLTVRALVQHTDPSGSVTTVLDEGAKENAPLGSIFKLYVLLAVQQQVQAGALSWSDTVAVSDANRSLPSGELQDAPNGTTVTVAEAATKMISISDNTATDMLIEKVGREAVEAAVASAGHHDAAQLTPFLTTREMFQLMWAVPAATRDAWRDASVDERRTMLESIDAMPLDIDVATIDTTPRWEEHIEWFATAADIAAVHDALAATDSPEVEAALTANAGIAADPAQYAAVAFKGGSNMGVLTGSWRAERPDGSVVTVVLLTSSNDAEKVGAATSEIFSLAADILRIQGED